MSRRTLILITVLLILLLLIFLGWWFFFRDTNGSAPPTAADDTFATLASTAVSNNILTNDSDPDGDALTVTETPVSASTNGTLTLVADGSFTYTPNAGFLGDDEFKYEVCDADNGCAQATVTISVWEAPVANDDATTTTQDTEVSGDVLGNDTPAGGLTVSTSLTTPPAHGTGVIQNSGDFTYQPVPGYLGDDSFTYSVCLTAAPDFCDTAVVSITVNGGNDVVDAIEDDYKTDENTAVSENVLTNDKPPSGLMVTIPLEKDPDSGSVEMQDNGAFTYTPNSDFTGTDMFTYKACDADDVCDTAVVTITVGEVIPVGGPEAVDDTFETPVNTAVSENVLTNDTHASGDTLTVDTTPIAAPTSGTLDLQTNGDFTYTPTTDFEGKDTFEYKVCDTVTLCDQAQVTIIVGAVPRAVDDTFSTTVNTELSADVLANDSDPNNLVLNVNTTPVDDVDNGQLTLADDGKFTYMPDKDFAGADQFTYQVCNSDGKCVEALVTITVTQQPTETTHTVARGEWLLQIARCYGTTSHAIRMANHIYNPNLIFPDQELIIPDVGSVGPVHAPPCVETYNVKSGDTPKTIAADFGMSQSEFMRLNAIPWPNGFYVGQFIVIPKPIPSYMLP